MNDPRTPVITARTRAEEQRRRRATRITALVFAGIALAIYAGFILSGVLRA